MDSSNTFDVKTIVDFAGILIALQIATTGWRIQREIPLGDEVRRTWFPVADYANVLSLISVVLCCVIFPVNDIASPRLSKITLSIGFILMGMYPINVVGHYRLATRLGRSIYGEESKLT